MSRVAYVNGRYLPHDSAAVHVEDRGFQFADGVYEVLYLYDGRLIDHTLHLDRLDRSLAALRLAAPLGRPALLAVIGELSVRNRLKNALVYMQVTRGSARREHPFPVCPPTLVITMRRTLPYPARIEDWTAAAITWPDERWTRCDIKSVALLPNILARQAAREAGALEAILHKDGMVTEGAATSVWIVDANGILVTHPASQAILPGCTRAELLRELGEGFAGQRQQVEERRFSLEELRGAREIFLSAATTFVKPVLKLDGETVGDGRPGPVARALFASFAAHVQGNRGGGGGRRPGALPLDPAKGYTP